MEARSTMMTMMTMRTPAEERMRASCAAVPAEAGRGSEPPSLLSRTAEPNKPSAEPVLAVRDGTPPAEPVLAQRDRGPPTRPACLTRERVPPAHRQAMHICEATK